MLFDDPERTNTHTHDQTKTTPESEPFPNDDDVMGWITVPAAAESKVRPPHSPTSTPTHTHIQTHIRTHTHTHTHAHTQCTEAHHFVFRHRLIGPPRAMASTDHLDKASADYLEHALRSLSLPCLCGGIQPTSSNPHKHTAWLPPRRHGSAPPTLPTTTPTATIITDPIPPASISSTTTGLPPRPPRSTQIAPTITHGHWLPPTTLHNFAAATTDHRGVGVDGNGGGVDTESGSDTKTDPAPGFDVKPQCLGRWV